MARSGLSSFCSALSLAGRHSFAEFSTGAPPTKEFSTGKRRIDVADVGYKAKSNTQDYQDY
jgi:hypothetical protein